MIVETETYHTIRNPGTNIVTRFLPRKGPVSAGLPAETP